MIIFTDKWKANRVESGSAPARSGEGLICHPSLRYTKTEVPSQVLFQASELQIWQNIHIRKASILD